jgi:uncharacterized protein YegL
MSEREMIDTTAATVNPAGKNILPYGEEVPEGTDGPVPVDGPPAAIPGVLVLDTSLSMRAVLDNVAAAVNKFVHDLQTVPAVAAQAHLAVVTFADTATTALPFCRIAEPGVHIPGLVAGGQGTNFQAAFDRTWEVLSDGIPRLALAGQGEARVVMRPTMYFVSDGQPNLPRGHVDSWKQSLARFDEPKWSPNRFAFGFGDADRDVIRAIASEGCAYFAATGVAELGALQHILDVILKSMLRLSQGVGTGRHQTAAPPPGPGLVRIDPVA